MAAYDIYILTGQSNIQKGDSISSAPVGTFTGNVLTGVKVWNASAIVDYNVNTTGPTGNGGNWVGVGGNPAGQYSWAQLVLRDRAIKGENVLCIQVSEGGSVLRQVTVANGSHNTDVAGLAASFPTTPILHTALVNRYNACIAYLGSNGHTYTVRGVLWDQGEADADALQLRLTNLTNKIASFRTFTGLPNLPVYWCTRPYSGNFQRPYMDEVDLQVAALSANNHCMKGWNLSTVDGAHFDAPTMIVVKDWVVNAMDGTQPEEEVVLTLPAITGTTYNILAKAVQYIGITDPDQAEATEYLITNLQSADLWDEIVGLYFMVGNNYALNLKNPNFRALTLSGASAVATGLNFDGVNDQIITNFRVQDLPNMRTSNFNVSFYLRENSFGVGTQAIGSWQGNAGRFFAPLSSQMRIYVGDVAVLAFSTITDNSGLLDFGVHSAQGTLHRNGVFRKTASYTANHFVNNMLVVGNDIDDTDWLDNIMPYFSYGYGLTDAQIAARYTIVQAALTIIGRQV